MDGEAVFLPLFELAVGLVVEGFLDGGEAVEVLDLDDGGGDDRAIGLGDVEVDVGVAAQGAFLHFAVGDAEVAEVEAQFFEAAAGVGRGADIGLGDDFEEGDARAVEVDLGVIARGVDELAGVFFEVDAGQAAACRRRRHPCEGGWPASRRC